MRFYNCLLASIVTASIIVSGSCTELNRMDSPDIDAETSQSENEIEGDPTWSSKPAERLNGGANESIDATASEVDATASETQEASSDETTCAVEGALRCSDEHGRNRERCQAGFWVEAEPCGDGEVCDTSDAAEPGSCISITEVCRGSSGENVCQGTVMHQCGDNAVSVGQESCESERHCELGVSSGTCAVCLTGEYQCKDTQLEKCADDGSEFVLDETCDTAALCNASAGACTDKACLPDSWKCDGDKLQRCNQDQTGFDDVQQCDPGMCNSEGEQCDVCIPGETHCENGNEVVTCNDTGQDFDRDACSGSTPYCTGSGKCVGCLDDKNCSTSLDCRLAYCSDDNECETTLAPKKTSCGPLDLRVCDSSGTCRECIDNDDCTDEICYDYECVECVGASDCDLGYECNPSTNTCYEVWRPCSSGCLSDQTCDNGLCRDFCDPTGGCPIVPGWTNACWVGICFLECSLWDPCPNGLSCKGSTDPYLCAI